jgi:ferrous iron transport protein A
MKPHPPLPLGACPLRRPFTVHTVQVPAGTTEWASQLHDLGFVPGERVQLMARGLGGDPLVVRVGWSTYALRRAEADCIQVLPV